jgi:hypothetical protein
MKKYWTFIFGIALLTTVAFFDDLSERKQNRRKKKQQIQCETNAIDTCVVKK